jgi:hypothetical protein
LLKSAKIAACYAYMASVDDLIYCCCAGVGVFFNKESWNRGEPIFETSIKAVFWRYACGKKGGSVFFDWVCN